MIVRLTAMAVSAGRRLHSFEQLYSIYDVDASRTELRLLNGFPNLLDLLHADHPEIVENAMHCLIRCSDDGMNQNEGMS
jgi:hypothetical protein